MHRSWRAKSFSAIVCLATCLGVWAGASVPMAVAERPAPTTAGPVSVKPAAESELGLIKLAPKSHERLGITTASVRIEASARRRCYGGDLAVPPGRIARMAAPFAGVVSAHPRGASVRVGQRVRRGDPVLGLQPILTEPERLRLAEVQLNLSASRADAEAQFDRARAQADVSVRAARRGAKLLEAEAGSARGLEEARAAQVGAEANLAAARTRRNLFSSASLDAPGALPVMPLESPLSGLVRDLPSPVGQTVSAGGILIEIADLSTLWMRVPVSVDELSGLATGSARVTVDGGRSGDGPFRVPGEVEAQPVEAPPTASAMAGTVDRWFALDNSASQWTPGMRVVASLPLSGQSTMQTVPWSAVVTDLTGHTWVYELAAPSTYSRRRVTVDRVDGDRAFLIAGPPAGTILAVTGVAELFGIDVGFAK